jgi:hypothetical protein
MNKRNLLSFLLTARCQTNAQLLTARAALGGAGQHLARDAAMLDASSRAFIQPTPAPLGLGTRIEPVQQGRAAYHGRVLSGQRSNVFWV